jgi:Flp pilus assembly pilin Flp
MRKTGSGTLEYAILIAVIIAALVSMFVYLKRGICGKWRESIDTIGFGQQYAPDVTIETK